MNSPRRFFSLHIAVLFTLLLAMVDSSAWAQVATATVVEVSNVEFSSQRLPNASDAWQEIDIELTAQASGRSPEEMFVNRVVVSLSVGVEVNRSGKTAIEFYRSTAELVALESGRRSNVRFYLPPEVVKRDGLRGDAKYFVIDVTAAGQPQKRSEPGVSRSTLAQPEIIQNFLSKVAAEAPKNDGVLLPQYLTPFAYNFSRQTPAFVRKDVK